MGGRFGGSEGKGLRERERAGERACAREQVCKGASARADLHAVRRIAQRVPCHIPAHGHKKLTHKSGHISQAPRYVSSTRSCDSLRAASEDTEGLHEVTETCIRITHT
eukprot:1504680-Pleurochrysis_carterae.AAC.2